MRTLTTCLVGVCTWVLSAAAPPAAGTEPFHKAELIFPLEHWHNHGSCIVETPNGDLLVCWFHGSGERQADDVKIEGARGRKGAADWSPRFTLADTPGYPDTNCCMFVDPRQRLWLLWPTILANEWHTALMKYRVSSRYQDDGPPRWDANEVLHVTPGPEFEETVKKAMEALEAGIGEGPPLKRERRPGAVGPVVPGVSASSPTAAGRAGPTKWRTAAGG